MFQKSFPYGLDNYIGGIIMENIFRVTFLGVTFLAEVY